MRRGPITCTSPKATITASAVAIMPIARVAGAAHRNDQAPRINAPTKIPTAPISGMTEQNTEMLNKRTMAIARGSKGLARSKSMSPRRNNVPAISDKAPNIIHRKTPIKPSAKRGQISAASSAAMPAPKATTPRPKPIAPKRTKPPNSQ